MLHVVSTLPLFLTDFLVHWKVTDFTAGLFMVMLCVPVIYKTLLPDLQIHRQLKQKYIVPPQIPTYFVLTATAVVTSNLRKNNFHEIVKFVSFHDGTSNKISQEKGYTSLLYY